VATHAVCHFVKRQGGVYEQIDGTGHQNLLTFGKPGPAGPARRHVRHVREGDLEPASIMAVAMAEDKTPEMRSRLMVARLAG
jgi:hypothetical protein